MLRLRRADSLRAQREGRMLGKGGEKGREPVTSVTEHLLWAMHYVQGFRSLFLGLTTNQPCKHCCPHFTEEETKVLKDKVAERIQDQVSLMPSSMLIQSIITIFNEIQRSIILRLCILWEGKRVDV